MKKYVITLVLILFCCIIIVLFSVPDRIQYALYGMSEYDLDDYNELRNDLPRCELVIDFSTYGKEPIMVYEYTEEVYLLLDSITYNGNSYTFCFVSHGSSSFSRGDIICFKENCQDICIENNNDEFIFQYTGNSSLEYDTIEYYFDLYPQNEMFNIENFTTMRIEIPIDQIVLLSYERL